MLDLKYIENYYNSNNALVLFLENMNTDNNELNYILNDTYLSGAKAMSIINILLSIKEDVIENLGNLEYNSIINKNNLLNSIKHISSIDKDFTCTIDNYTFNTPESLIVTIRNKFAHGDYTIDFNTKEFIIYIENTYIKVDINKMSLLVISLLYNSYRDKLVKYEERLKGLYRYTEEKNSLTTKEELYKHLKNVSVVKTTLHKDDNNYIDKLKLESFYYYLEILEKNDFNYPTIDFIRKEFKKYGYTFKVEFLKLLPKEIKSIVDLTSESLLNNNYSFVDQLNIMMLEAVSKKGQDKIDLLNANLSNLILLESIEKNKTTNIDALVNDIVTNYNSPYYISHNNLVASLIGMFNTLFIIPFDKFYKGTSDNKYFDFSILDLDLIEVTYIDNNTILFNTLKDKIKSKERELDGINTSIDKIENNYRNVLKLGNARVLEKIKSSLELQKEKKTSIVNELSILNSNLLEKNNYYIDNSKYIENRNIIEGIRNSISHGNIKVITEEDNIYIEFNDIYQDKITFSSRVLLKDFYFICNSNYEILLNYLEEYNKKVIK